MTGLVVKNGVHCSQSPLRLEEEEEQRKGEKA